LSTAYHLASLGMQDVVVLDRFAPGSQASARAAGLFKHIQTDETRSRLAARSIDIVTHFEALSGVRLPVVKSGSIMAARTPEYAAIVREEATQSRAWGVDVEMVDAQEARRLMPFLAPNSTLAACFTPADIYIEEPASLLLAYLQAGARLGMSVLGHMPATGIRVSGGEVAGVLTPAGEIATPLVIDAAGAWSRQVGAFARAEVVIAPVRHQLFITEPIGGIEPTMPILRSIDTAVYVRPARGGLMFGCFEKDPLPLDPRGERATFSTDDISLDLDVLQHASGTVSDQVPVLQGADIDEHRGGLFTMTPDGQLVVGPIEAIHGLWCATGCNGSGFSLSPAIGQQLAEWIVGGHPSIDLSSLNPGRFGDKALDEQWLLRTAIWQYGHYYERGQQPS
jgi:glycine/D-amino acid oxidase-like deaminating enzyme